MSTQSTQLTTRVSPTIAEKVKKQAEDRGISPSEFLRSLLLQELEKQGGLVA